MGFLDWVIAVEYAAFGVTGIRWAILEAAERALWRRIAREVLTQHPIASVQPPTTTLIGPDEWVLHQQYRLRFGGGPRVPGE